MANLFTEKTYDEAMRPLINYEGDDAYVKGDIYSMLNGGDLYDYARNYNVWKTRKPTTTTIFGRALATFSWANLRNAKKPTLPTNI